MTKNPLLLIFIFVLSLIPRIYRVNNYPPLLWDEASLGYNAYSILKTGRDEYGQFFPLTFKSFGDYKPGLYVYLTVPFVAIFGLSETSTRLPSVILGSLLPVLLYLFIQKTTKNKTLALISSLVLALNPFNIHFSRGAWETNILTFELLLAAYLFFVNRYSLSALVLGSTLYTYQSAKLITPLLILALLFCLRPKIKSLLSPFLILAIFALPLLNSLFFGQASNRLKVVSLFSYPRSAAETQTILSESNQLDYNLFHNRPIFFIRNFFSRYFNHFSPRFLLFEGDWQNPRHSAPYIGVILYPSIIFLLLGLLTVNYRQSPSKFFLLWLLLAPIPSALTRDSLSAVRAMSLSLPLVFFISQGVYYLIKKYSGFIVYSLILTAYLLSFIYYSDLYFNHLVKKSPTDYLYGYHQAINYLVNHQSSFQNIYFTQFYGQPYIYYLFYTSYPPSQYQSQAKLISSSVDTGQINQIDNIRFTEPNFAQLSSHPSSLGIFNYDEVVRQNIDLRFLTPLSPINNISTFYAYQNP